MEKIKLLFSIITITSLFFCSCATLKNVTQKQVNNRKVEYVEAGNGSPTVVLETGLGPDIKTWLPIFDSLAAITHVFAYNRPGYGNSGLLHAPENVKQVAEQLHENLKATGQQAPYILMGHSAGGLYINMFARLYPDEVASVVFLDASHPEQFEYFRKHQPLLYSMLVSSTTKSKRKYELSIIKGTMSDFVDAPPFPNVPIVVLTAGKKSSPLETDRLRQKWLRFQSELAALSEESNHVVVEGSGHFIHKDKPGVVLEEIRKIIKKQ
ncbi:MAG: alpha/beta hydrolase [Bacteroidota bacterium]